jgi:hypothetical protein
VALDHLWPTTLSPFFILGIFVRITELNHLHAPRNIASIKPPPPTSIPYNQTPEARLGPAHSFLPLTLGLCTRKLAATTKNTLLPTLHHYNELLMGAPPVSTRYLHRSGTSEMRARISCIVISPYSSYSTFLSSLRNSICAGALFVSICSKHPP